MSILLKNYNFIDLNSHYIQYCLYVSLVICCHCVNMVTELSWNWNFHVRQMAYKMQLLGGVKYWMVMMVSGLQNARVESTYKTLQLHVFQGWKYCKWQNRLKHKWILLWIFGIEWFRLSHVGCKMQSTINQSSLQNLSIGFYTHLPLVFLIFPMNFLILVKLGKMEIAISFKGRKLLLSCIIVENNPRGWKRGFLQERIFPWMALSLNPCS